MRIPTQPGSSSTTPAPRGRPNHASPAAPVAPPGLQLNTLATLTAIFAIGAIALARHWGGSLDIISVGWTTAAAIGALGFAGLFAQGLIRNFGRSNAFANAAFVFTMTLTSTSIALIKGPFHEFAVAQLSTRWPDGAALLAKTDPDSHAAKSAHSASKSDAVIHVYRKNDQSATAQPKGD